MGNLKRTDIVISLIFGCVISLLCFQLQPSKKSNRDSHKKEEQQLSLSLQLNPHSNRNNFAFNSKYHQRGPASLDNDSTPSTEEDDGYSNPENDPAAEGEKAQVEREMSLLMERKIEKYLFDQIGLPGKEISRFLYAKRFMEEEIQKNNKGIINPTDETSAELNNLNQQILSNYQEEVKQILGPENYQRYSMWQGEQDAAFSESYASGKPISMDDI